MAVDTKLIAQLREQTGAGVVDAKKALQEANDDYDKAIEILRKRGQSVAAKKADRVAAAGLVEAYVHGQGRVGVLLRINCETDFVARTDKFKELAHQVAMHVAAFDPTYISRNDVPSDVIAKAKAAQGDLNNFFREVCLLEQPFVMDDKRTVQEVITEKIAEVGENIQVTAIKRISL